MVDWGRQGAVFLKIQVFILMEIPVLRLKLKNENLKTNA
jgi:hypothetical protein